LLIHWTIWPSQKYQKSDSMFITKWSSIYIPLWPTKVGAPTR
jgi:hypothetical protein